MWVKFVEEIGEEAAVLLGFDSFDEALEYAAKLDSVSEEK